jgi:hypothetical protein
MHTNVLNEIIQIKRIKLKELKLDKQKLITNEPYYNLNSN